MVVPSRQFEHQRPVTEDSSTADSQTLDSIAEAPSERPLDSDGERKPEARFGLLVVRLPSPQLGARGVEQSVPASEPRLRIPRFCTPLGPALESATRAAESAMELSLKEWPGERPSP
jgi:hypothetical protein